MAEIRYVVEKNQTKQTKPKTKQTKPKTRSTKLSKTHQVSLFCEFSLHAKFQFPRLCLSCISTQDSYIQYCLEKPRQPNQTKNQTNPINFFWIYLQTTSTAWVLGKSKSKFQRNNYFNILRAYLTPPPLPDQG